MPSAFGRALRPWTLATLVVAALAAPAGSAPRAKNAAASPAVTLPDTGLFAPVARQYREREARVRALGSGAVTTERLRMLLSAGRMDEAAKLAASAAGDSVEVRVARGRVWLACQDFAALRPLARGLDRPGATAAERMLRYDWLIACDDAPRVDSLTKSAIGATAGEGDAGILPELLAAGRLAYDMLDYPRAESLLTRALARLPAVSDSTGTSGAAAMRSAALTGLGLVKQKLRDWDGSLTVLRDAIGASANPGALWALSEALIRMGRTDEAISSVEWGVRLNPYHDGCHYLLGNGYARRNYTQLRAARPEVFADSSALVKADALLAAGKRIDARAAYGRLVQAHPKWVDARVRLASLDFEEGRFAESRDGCFAALQTCPEYGRAHGVLAKALEAQRFAVDVHRPGYEARFRAAAMPEVPGIEKFVTNWSSLSARHQKRVALSIAPWRAFIPVLVEGGATFYIKPVHLLLSECPNLETLRDQRINYDSRLWDDVRGCGGYHTVTGIEDVERTIFDRYNTVLHELSHQVHSVLTADDSRRILEHYRRAKERDDASKEGFLSRYAGGSVHEYFAEGANALDSPMRDAYDPREVVRERLDRRDPDLRKMVEDFLARKDVSASYPIAYASGGDDRTERGRVADALPFYRKALERSPTDETALTSLTRALLLSNRAAEAEATVARAVAAHPGSGTVQAWRAEAGWHAGRGIAAVSAALDSARSAVRAEDRAIVSGELGGLAWTAGDAPRALAEYDSVLAYQSDSPDGLSGRAMSLALAGQSDSAFVWFDRAVRMRTGVVDLRCAYAGALLAAGRHEAARTQLDEAKLLDERNPEAEALRAWAELIRGRHDAARSHARQALEWGSWCDLARIVAGGIEARDGHAEKAQAAWAPVLDRIARNAPPEYVYRPAMSSWEQIHTLPATERRLLDSFRGKP